MAYQIIIQVLIILAAAILTGEIFEQFRLPSVAGELLSGIVLGPTVFNLISTNDQIQAISSIALFFVIFLIGFEMNTDIPKKHIRHGAGPLAELVHPADAHDLRHRAIPLSVRPGP